jgi:proteic killer suppression protein
MILGWRHKGLRLFFETGATSGIRPDHSKRLARILMILDRATCPEDVNLPGWRLHQLKGDLSGFWSITVTANWRVIFRFVDTDVELVNYVDYH